jgi:hypothetical protein
VETQRGKNGASKVHPIASGEATFVSAIGPGNPLRWAAPTEQAVCASGTLPKPLIKFNTSNFHYKERYFLK